MAAQLGLKLGKWLYRKGQISEDQIDLIRYVFEIICSEVTEIIIILIYGICFHKVIETLLYLAFFHILRKFFQGYHAKTILRCLTLTVGSYLVTLITFIYVDPFMITFSLIVSSILQIEYCIKKGELIPILVSILLWVLSVVLYFMNQDILPLAILAIVELIVSISLIPERSTYEK